MSVGIATAGMLLETLRAMPEEAEDAVSISLVDGLAGLCKMGYGEATLTVRTHDGRGISLEWHTWTAASAWNWVMGAN